MNEAAKQFVDETISSFLSAEPTDPSRDPVAVCREHYLATADDALKARNEAEGRTPEGAYAFMGEVARTLHRKVGGNAEVCIGDRTGLAIVMHYMTDAPADILPFFEPALVKEREEREKAEQTARAAENAAKWAAEREAREAARKAKEEAKNNAPVQLTFF